MFFYIDRIELEVKNLLNFWQKHVFKNGEISLEVFNSGHTNPNAPESSILYAGIVYGASRLSRFLGNDTPLPLAQKAYSNLQMNLANPNGGYYFGLNNNGTIKHDIYLVSYSQAFVALALAEYYMATSSITALNELKTQIKFIENTLADNVFGGYLDGYYQQWEKQKEQKKSLRTHLRLMEAYAAYYKITSDKNIINKLEELVGLVNCQFFNDKSLTTVNVFTPDWINVSENYHVGYQAETAWLLPHCAEITKNESLIAQSKEIAIQLSNNILDTAFDNNYGGIFTSLNNFQTPIQTNKEFWVQAETTLAMLNSFAISGEKQFLNFALRLYEYIDNTFTDETNGELYDVVTREGSPINDKPKIHQFKTLHRNVRYYLKAHQLFNSISKTSLHIAG